MEGTFAPVAKGDIIRLLLALAQLIKLYVHQMNANTAFLYASLLEKNCMKAPRILDGQALCCV